eukprot:522654-Prymnesium_polylepis.1
MTITCPQKTFLVVYGVITFIDLFMLVWNLFDDTIPYEPVGSGEEGNSMLNPTVFYFNAFDYVWFLCLPLTTVFLPSKHLIAYHAVLVRNSQRESERKSTEGAMVVSAITDAGLPTDEEPCCDFGCCAINVLEDQ